MTCKLLDTLTSLVSFSPIFASPTGRIFEEKLLSLLRGLFSILKNTSCPQAESVKICTVVYKEVILLEKEFRLMTLKLLLFLAF
jgi:hypothetical protein